MTKTTTYASFHCGNVRLMLASSPEASDGLTTTAYFTRGEAEKLIEQLQTVVASMPRIGTMEDL